MLTEQQINRYRKMFAIFDVNKNGILEGGELSAIAEHLEWILKYFKLGPGGTLNFDQYLQGMAATGGVLGGSAPRPVGQTAGVYSISTGAAPAPGAGMQVVYEPGSAIQSRAAATYQTRAPVQRFQFSSDTARARAEILAMFRKFDRDGNGFISRDEAHSILSQELGFTPDRTISLMDQFDVNRDGRLSYNEFIGFWLKIRERRQAIDQAFRQFDVGNKGYVTCEDAKRILGGMLFSDREVEALVQAHDTNRDGKLQYDEFVHFWMA